MGPRCHELRIRDAGANWRVFYRIDSDAIVIVDIINKQSRKTPKPSLDAGRKRLGRYDDA